MYDVVMADAWHKWYLIIKVANWYHSLERNCWACRRGRGTYCNIFSVVPRYFDMLGDFMVLS